MPDTQLRAILCDPSGRVHCPTCDALKVVEIMRAKQRGPLVACMQLGCGHAWHLTFRGLDPEEHGTPCDCPHR